MTSPLLRREPVISFGTGPAKPAAVPRRIIRPSRRAPTGDLTRRIRREQSQDALDHVRDALTLSPATFRALSVELLAADGPMLGDDTLRRAMRGLFHFEAIAPTTPHPIILVGGAQPERTRVAVALSQRLEWAGRRVSLCSFDDGAVMIPREETCGGLGYLKVGSVDACIAAVRSREPYEMAVIDASCLDDAHVLQRLTSTLKAETIYVDDGQSPLPDFDLLSGIERLILSGRPERARFGAVLDLAYRRGMAFAGQSCGRGIFHPMTPAILADRVAVSIR